MYKVFFTFAGETVSHAGPFRSQGEARSYAKRYIKGMPGKRLAYSIKQYGVDYNPKGRSRRDGVRKWWRVLVVTSGGTFPRSVGKVEATRAELEKEFGGASASWDEREYSGEVTLYQRPRRQEGVRRNSPKSRTRYMRFYSLSQMRRYAKEHPEMRVWLSGMITTREIYAGVRPKALRSKTSASPRSKATEKCDFCKRRFKRGSLARDAVDSALLICSMCKGRSSLKNPRGRYYLDGYHNGAEAAKVNIQEDPSLLAKYVEQDRLGEFVGELREHQVQFTGDISYDVGRGVTEHQYESWESGFTDGFFATVKKWLKGYRPTERQRTLLNRRR